MTKLLIISLCFLCPLWLYSLCLCVFVTKNPRNLCNLWLINDLRLRILTYEIIKLFCKTNPNSEKVKWTQPIYWQGIMTKWTLGQLGKTNPKRTQTNPKRTQTQKGRNERNYYYNSGLWKYIKLGNLWKRTQNKPNSKPIQTQFQTGQNAVVRTVFPGLGRCAFISYVIKAQKVCVFALK